VPPPSPLTKATTSFPLELRRKDLIVKTETLSRKRKGKREYLNGSQTRQLMKQLNAFFERIVEVPRIRIGGRQTIETLINEEALLFAQYLRSEKIQWIPRIQHSVCTRAVR